MLVGGAFWGGKIEESRNNKENQISDGSEIWIRLEPSKTIHLSLWHSLESWIPFPFA